MDASLPKIRRLRATPVNVPLARPHPTASGVVSSAPLVLMDLETDQGLTGHAYVFCYTPIALKPIAELIEALQPLIQGDAVAPLVLAQKLQGRFRLLGPQGFTGIAMAAIDMAAWDVLAKSAGLSLTRLLGGEEKPVPAYHSLGMAGPDGAAQEAAELSTGDWTGIPGIIQYRRISPPDPQVFTGLDLSKYSATPKAGFVRFVITRSVPPSMLRNE